MDSSIFNNTPASQFIDVKVSIGGKTKTRNLKLCKVKPRSVLFILVDKENRVNTFYKIKYSDIAEYLPAVQFLRLKDGKLPDKWESAWDSISTNPVKMSPYGRQSLTNYSSYMKPSTTNSPAGFPMV